jgi:uncharacterized protein (DUF4415 family)
VNKINSARRLTSDLKKVDAHVIASSEYDELPELTDEMLSRSIVKKAGRPVIDNPREMISLRVPSEVLDKWRATGPGWQTRMVQRLSRAPLPASSKA